MTRSIVKWAVSLALGVLIQASAWAQAYPQRPVRWIVPYPAGGGSDVIARLLATVMKDELGQPLVVENRPGAGTIIGAQETAAAQADGYTILSADAGTLAYNPTLYSRLPYDAEKSFIYVGAFVRTPMALVARPGLRVASLKELIADARQHPGKYTYASAGPGSPHQLAMEMFQQRTGVRFVHVPYKGGAPAMQDVMAGQVDLMMLDVPGGIAQMKAGRVQLLGLAMPGRMPQLPDLPTLSELGLDDFVAFSWQGIVVPAATPAPVVARLEAALAKALASPVVKQRLFDIGADPMSLAGPEFAAYARAERRKWGQVIQVANIRLD